MTRPDDLRPIPPTEWQSRGNNCQTHGRPAPGLVAMVAELGNGRRIGLDGGALSLRREAEVAGDGLRPVDRAELAEDVPHMRLDGALRDHEMVSDLRVRGAYGEQ